MASETGRILTAFIFTRMSPIYKIESMSHSTSIVWKTLLVYQSVMSVQFIFLGLVLYGTIGDAVLLSRGS